MDLNFTPEEEAFREDVRSLSEREASRARARRQGADRQAAQQGRTWRGWHATLNERGWFANHWPVDYGGPGWSVAHRFIFDVETALAARAADHPVRRLDARPGVDPKYGSEAQKSLLAAAHPRRHRLVVPGLFRARRRLGSRQPSNAPRCATATSMSSTARRPGRRSASIADMIFCLVRTSTEGKKQEGISFLLIDMKSRPASRSVRSCCSTASAR